MFHFQVEWDGHVLSFQEVSGMDVEQAMNRGNGGVAASVIKMPGMRKYGSVTLKKGMAAGTSEFRDWFQRILMNTIERKPVVIRLVDESGDAMAAWTLANAFPVKAMAADLGSSGEAFAIEAIELVHEGIRKAVR